ncbi:non-ribosomal peptide synthetase [Gloeocapsa sp. PCC 73106]|uniref:non-ribosomal peptide synthetase n=1 Tax=Gloeocapsa sp. PCC 73106 TaxID=102232 RepID=UPI0002ABAD0C|nr:non-ribosomal peptide synthetase [Gloeocapsa sp. PCC 73106]ELR97620.1 non-ribosomal peptide synthase/amino acid adenylation enzyme [Gloeocapsa sp. PCC 73106]
MLNDELSKRIAALSPEKRAIFAEQLKKRNLKTIIPRKDKNSLPLSFSQERLWFLQQLEQNNAAYNIAIAWYFTGQLDIHKLENSLNQIIQRHEVLRTRFPASDGKPYQHILPHLTLEIPIIQVQPEKLEAITLQEARRPFNLETEPLLRVTLLQLSPEKSILLVTFHHIIADGWSRGIFLKELISFYKGENNLPELPIQYVDFAEWEKNWLKGEQLQTQLDYWKTNLAYLPVLNLPTDFTRPAVQSFQGATQSFNLSQSLTDSLKKLSRSEGVTLFMTLLTAFKILLHRYTGQDDLVIGSPIANRNSQETEPLIGFFVNTLLLRSNLSGNPTFVDLLQQIKTVTTEAYKHQDIPFAKLVEELQPERNLSHNPLFQVMFQLQNEAYQLQNASSPELTIPNLKLEQSWIDTQFTKFDLTWHLVERETGILGVIEYSTDLFKPEAIARTSQHFLQLLSGIIANPQSRISELPLLTKSEQNQLLVIGNQPDESLELIHQLFEKQVEKTPNNIAVTCVNKQLTYQELNQKANQLAHYLQKLGVKPETLVGIYFKRSLEMVVAILGILKAGGAYVPLDPAYPQERLAYMLEDGKVSLLLTQTELLNKLPSEDIGNREQGTGNRGTPEQGNKLLNKLPATNLKIINISLDIETDDLSNPISQLNKDNLAYVIYTSGSTGKPKGTMLTHGGLINYLNWAIEAYRVAEGEGSPVQSSIGFDATITSLYTPLLVGKKVVLLPEEQAIEALNTDSKYSLLKLTPAYLKILSQFPLKTAPNALVIGGEALSGNSLTFWRTHTPNTRLINEYGPTETVVGCCVYEVEASLSGAVPIGKAIAHTQLYILDRYLQLVPVGIPGELYIGGAGLARGYLNRPHLTAEKFIPNPFIPGERLYKTGDLARYLSDGNIEYLGRLDEQVKLRGFRIELGEIEAVLSQHPQVKDNLVTVHEDSQRTKHLVAYIVSETTQDWRDFLKSKLPDHMIPSVFIPLSAFPLTANEKIDRKALPIPNFSSQKASLTLPRTPEEEILSKIWTEVLGKESISVEDNFFALGGDSILSLQIIAKAHQKGLKITPRQLFEHQTIASIATVAEKSTLSKAEQGIVTGNVPLTPIQEWFFTQNLVEPHHYNQSILLEMSPQTRPELIEKALHKLLIHHDALRLQFTLTEMGWQQFNAAPKENLSFTVINLTGQSKEQIPETATQVQASLNLTDGTVFRAVYFEFNAQASGYLLLVAHHLVIDAISWRILIEDLLTGYQQLTKGEEIQLPAKTKSYQDWANYLSQSGDLIAAETTQLIPLPVDYAEGDNTVASIAQTVTFLTPEETQALLTDVPPIYQTQINDLLLTALTQAFTQWTKQPTLLIDLESHGRDINDLDVSRTVGWFTAIAPTYLDLTDIHKLGDAIKSIKEQLRQTNAKMSYQSAEVIFNYLGQLDRVSTDFPIIKLIDEWHGEKRSPRQTRRYLLEINSFIRDNQLQVIWNYSQNIHKKSTIDSVAKDYIDALKSLINHCLAVNTKGYTPSDFSGAKLEQKQLDKLLNKIGKRR